MDMSGGATSSNDAMAVEYPEIKQLKKDHLREREGLMLTKRPLATLKLSSLAVLEQLRHLWDHIVCHRLTFLALCIFILISVTVLAMLDSGHNKILNRLPLEICIGGDLLQQQYRVVKYVREVLAYMRFGFWWIGLGVASSIGFGSGLHTFVLYLGPHVALFTMRATQCGRVDLKCAPYDTPQFGLSSSWSNKECAEIGEPIYPHIKTGLDRYMVPLHKVLMQVQLEAMLWGLGTTLGELPPYFVSRAARLSGERVKELDELVSQESSSSDSLFDQLKRWTLTHFQQFGFFTILLFASVPNPLFDLAGIMCGQFLVPFWKFFLATLIGKALIKTHIQTVFIILVCNAHLLEMLETGLAWLILRIPVLARLSPRIMAALGNAKASFDGINPETKAVQGNFSIAFVWNTIVLFMMASFLGSIITSMAQGYLMERQKLELSGLLEKLGNHKKEMLVSKNLSNDS